QNLGSPIIFSASSEFGGCTMGVLFSPEFWPDPLAIALKASAIVIPLLVLAFWVGWKLKGSINDKEIRALRMQKKLADEQVNAAGQAAARQAQPIAKSKQDLPTWRGRLQISRR